MASKTLTLGRKCTARISYYCDLQREHGLVIPLGVIAEVTVGQIRGLGLFARTSLQGRELQHIGSLMRQQLANPFDFLLAQFEWAWESTRRGEALEALARRHTDSLFFSPPKVAGFSVEEQSVEPKLHSLLRTEYKSFLEALLHKATATRVAPEISTFSRLRKAA